MLTLTHHTRPPDGFSWSYEWPPKCMIGSQLEAVMRTTMRCLAPASVLALGGWLMTSNVYASPDFAKKERRDCVYCHTTKTSRELNDAGKYYKKHKTLEGYEKGKVKT